MKVHRWKDIRDKKIGADRLAKIKGEIARELVEMDLRAIREAAGKTQVEVAEELESTQAEISRFERRDDVRLSSLRRYVEALGGELEVVANFGDHRIRLRSAE